MWASPRTLGNRGTPLAGTQSACRGSVSGTMSESDCVAYDSDAINRMAERRQRRENQLPLHRTPSQTRNRAIMFADEKPQSPNPMQVPLPSPPPPTVTRNRSPTPQVAVRSSESDSSSINSRNSSSRDARSSRGDEQITKDANQSVENAHSSSTSISGKDIVPPGISVPSPVYSDSGAKN